MIWLWWRSSRPESDRLASVRPRQQSPHQAVDETGRPGSESGSRPDPADSDEELMSELVQSLVARAEVVQQKPVIAPASLPGPEPFDGGEESMAHVRAVVSDELPVTESPFRPMSEPEQAPQPSSGGHGDGDGPFNAVGDSSEELMAELALIRTDVVKQVERRPLFVMAERRGVPFFQLFCMTKRELFEAVLEAEGLPPHDVAPSSQSAARIREIAAEALGLHEELAADEAHLLSDQTA
jgi:hypothetical protein